MSLASWRLHHALLDDRSLINSPYCLGNMVRRMNTPVERSEQQKTLDSALARAAHSRLRVEFRRLFHIRNVAKAATRDAERHSKPVEPQ